jgi:L-cysteine/cystine lyase
MADEHVGGLGAVWAAATRTGAEIVVVDVESGGDRDAILDAFTAAIGGGVRVIALSHVAWTTGALLPIAEIASLGHAAGGTVVVDGAQSVGAIPVNVAELGVDFYAVPGQKWLLGPEGTGALWASPAATRNARVPVGSWYSYERIDGHKAVPRSNARRFEEPGHYRPGITGLARSCGWLSMYVGLPWIHDRGRSMARTALERLAAIPGVEMLTRPASMATLVTFRIRGWDASAALDEIAGRTFTIARTIPSLDAIRLSIGFFTTHDEIERVAAAVELLAAHTPETLPKRPRLTIIDAS